MRDDILDTRLFTPKEVLTIGMVCFIIGIIIMWIISLLK